MSETNDKKPLTDKETIARMVEWFKMNGLDIPTIIDAQLLHPWKQNGFYNNDEKPKPLFNACADYFLDIYKAVTKDSGLWVYEDGHYKILNKRNLKTILDKITDKKVMPGHYEKFIEKIYSLSGELNRDFASTKDMINMSNGILNVKTKELMPHSPVYFFKYKLKISYEPNAKCDRFLEFLNYILDGNQEQISLIGEMFGYCLQGGYPWLHKAFVLFGEGRNGKSTLLEILRHMLGESNISSVSLGYLDKPFSVVSLDGKLANIVDETPNDRLNAELFKLATAGGNLRAAQKNQPEYDLAVNARFVFACNKMPQFHESTTGLLERFCFVNFSKYIPEKERDSSIKENILKNEMSGIINFALDGLDRLIKRGHLPTLSQHEMLLDEYRRESDSVFDWASQRIEINLEVDGVRPYFTEELFKDYTKFCDENKRSVVHSNNFAKRLASFFRSKLNGKYPSITVHRAGGNGYKFIRLKQRVSIFDS